MLNDFIRKKFFNALEAIEYGSLVVHCPDDQVRYFHGSDDLIVTVKVHSWRIISDIMAKGDVGFAESYRDGILETDDLTGLCELFVHNTQLFDGYMYGGSVFSLVSKLAYYLRSNTVRGSKKNIHAHYDLGNDFYSAWLDPTMTYSAGIFNNDHETLTQAQYNKYDRIIQRFGSKSGKLLEVGCGWGGFAERAVETADMDVKGITISNEQYHFAKQRLDRKANIVLEDYRKQEGKFDQIVSIEMFEAVGEKFWPVYFQKLKSLLQKNGKAVLQTITMDEKYFDRYRKSADMIRTFIFPGGMLPSKTRFAQEACKVGLKVTDQYDFGRDYAHTIEHWKDAFEHSIDRIKALGFDEKFIRLWRLYLCACIAGFQVKRTSVIQAELQHA